MLSWNANVFRLLTPPDSIYSFYAITHSLVDYILECVLWEGDFVFLLTSVPAGPRHQRSKETSGWAGSTFEALPLRTFMCSLLVPANLFQLVELRLGSR